VFDKRTLIYLISDICYVLGTRYRPEEIEEIQILAEQGYSNQQIADKLGRTQAAIRNIRHRNKIKTQTQNTIETLTNQKTTLNKTTQKLQTQITYLQSRHRQVKKALQLDEETLQNNATDNAQILNRKTGQIEKTILHEKMNCFK